MKPAFPFMMCACQTSNFGLAAVATAGGLCCGECLREYQGLCLCKYHNRVGGACVVLSARLALTAAVIIAVE